MEDQTTSFSFVRRKRDDTELSDGEIDYETPETEAAADSNEVIGGDYSQADESQTNALHIVDTWEEITKRDKPVEEDVLVHVMAHSMAMLGERLCEASNDLKFRDSLKAFDHTLGRFGNSEIELGKRIASGSFADIYLIKSFRGSQSFDGGPNREQFKAARVIKQTSPDEYVVKVLKKTLLVNRKLFATGAADFVTEGTLLASFDHPHIMSIRGRSIKGVEGFHSGKRDCLFLVLERMNGDLSQKLQEWKKKSSEKGLFAKGRKNANISLMCERLLLMANLANALAYLHERNVIHRDLSLGNVGISFKGGILKLLDFGLAKIVPASTDENERFLLTGKTGSIRYMAPEISLRQPYNLKADVYSFTILLYEVLTLEKAFRNWQTSEIYMKVNRKGVRPRISLFWSKRLKELVGSCWSANPDDRLTMKTVEAALIDEVGDLQASMESS